MKTGDKTFHCSNDWHFDGEYCCGFVLTDQLIYRIQKYINIHEVNVGRQFYDFSPVPALSKVVLIQRKQTEKTEGASFFCWITLKQTFYEIVKISFRFR